MKWGKNATEQMLSDCFEYTGMPNELRDEPRTETIGSMNREGLKRVHLYWLVGAGMSCQYQQ